ncbi:MAG: CinA family nicotinamide mononucleotide deamidase-related protein, partial [Candidatus Eisenbacteria bacterium]|nr:CinA family nicotinamide mononucleotide deamidase-related protein [Candidatus Eisenbacteria bacterium]
RIEVITIGGEILRGEVLDRNFAGIARLCAAAGYPVAEHLTLPDEPEEIAAAISAALARGAWVIATGGLGATPDDRTREAAARALGVAVERDEALAESLAARLRARGGALPEHARRMADLPAGAEPLPNEAGVAPGFLARGGGGLLFALPGVPVEAEAMMRAEVLPRLAEEASREPSPILAARLRTAGVSENELAQRIEPLLDGGVRAAYLPAAGRVDLHFSVAGGAAGRAALEAVLDRARAALGARVYALGEASLAGVVVDLFRRAGRTLAVAESLTGGAVGQALTRVPGSSAVFLGDLVAYADRAKTALLGVPPSTLAAHGAVSAQTAAGMAEGARRAYGASVAVATTGIAGPGGGSESKPVGLVWFGLADSAGVRCYRRAGGGGRVLVQDRATTTALDLLRLHAIGRLDLAGTPGLESRVEGGPRAEAPEDPGAGPPAG